MRQASPPDTPFHLRLARRRFWLWALGLAAGSSIAIIGAPNANYVDFPQMWSAGGTVGTADLVDGARHGAWQIANGVLPGFFAYPPGSAWLFAPLAALPLAAAFWVHALVMTALVAMAGLLGARCYGLAGRVGLVAAFAWAPCMASAALGQNAALALVLVLLTIEGLRREDDWLAGLGTALLLYKPSLAVPLLALLLLRRRWPALAIAISGGGVWYLLGVAGAGGDWAWPRLWLDGLSHYYGVDTAGNVARTISIPGLMQGHGLPWLPALIVAAAVAVAALPRLLRASAVEAGAGAVLVWLAISPHSLNYEAALILPALLWAVGATGTGLAEPMRTRLVVLAFLVAPVYVVSNAVGFSVLAAITIAAALIWIAGWWRLEAGGSPVADDSPGTPSDAGRRPFELARGS